MFYVIERYYDNFRIEASLLTADEAHALGHHGRSAKRDNLCDTYVDVYPTLGSALRAFSNTIPTAK